MFLSKSKLASANGGSRRPPLQSREVRSSANSEIGGTNPLIPSIGGIQRPVNSEICKTNPPIPSNGGIQPARFILLLALTLAALMAQSSSEDVRRVGSRLACKCGCPHTVASCDMFECEFSKPAKLRIAKLKGEGVSDQAIIEEYQQKYGADIFRPEPNAFGWLVPYLSVIPGVALIAWFIRRYRQPKPAAALGATGATTVDLDDPALAKYKDQIEKDLSRLDSE